MILYITKTILCSSLLYLVYHFVLEKEKMHKFKRFYLLFAIVFSLTVPLITIPTFSVVIVEEPISQGIAYFIEDNIIANENIAQTNSSNNKSNVYYIILAASTTISLILISRYSWNLYRIIKASKKYNTTINIGKAKIALIEKREVPHSFWNTIFLNKEDYENNKIGKEILTHELTHVRQKHTTDVLFIELLIALCWFNPALYLYRRAIKLNHEFLADQSVVNQLDQVSEYQLLLINQASNKHCVLASNFNYQVTKKRLTMMSKKTTRIKVLICSILLAPFSILVASTFGNKETESEMQVIIKQGYSLTKQDSIKKEGFFFPNSIHFKDLNTDIAEDQKKEFQIPVDFLNKNMDAYLVVTGYANEHSGTEQECETASRERATKVADLLSKEYNIDKKRIIIDWKGSEIQPFFKEEMNNAVLFYIDWEENR